MREYKKDISLNSREDFENLAKRIMEPLIPYYSKGKARLKIGNTAAHYPEIAAQMEGFSRPLWALGPMISGGGVYLEFVEIYRQGLISGTDPNHPEYWGPVEDYDQRLVEMAAIAYALILAPETFYEPLNLKEKENLVNWLNQINVNPILRTASNQVFDGTKNRRVLGDNQIHTLFNSLCHRVFTNIKGNHDPLDILV